MILTFISQSKHPCIPVCRTISPRISYVGKKKCQIYTKQVGKHSTMKLCMYVFCTRHINIVTIFTPPVYILHIEICSRDNIHKRASREYGKGPVDEVISGVLVLPTPSTLIPYGRLFCKKRKERDLERGKRAPNWKFD